MSTGIRQVRRLAVAALFLAGGCIPSPVTREGRAITDLYLAAMAAAAVVAVLVWSLLTWAVLRYRRRDGTSLPRQVHGNVRLELVWTGIPTIAVFALFAGTLLALQPIEGATRPQPAVELRVEAFRWGWRFDYPAEGVSVTGTLDQAAEAVLPVGEPVEVTVTSNDVVHAWYVPQFLFKRDVTPGHATTFPLIIEQAGTYAGQCAEFCGLYHARMPFSIRAVDPAEYRAWLDQTRVGASPSPQP